MKEGMTSIYSSTTDPSISSAHKPDPSNPSVSSIDNDAALAEAFKAEFLAEMEERSLRRRPAPAAPGTNAGGSGSGAGGAGAGDGMTGPKLGGSRSMREKMRAAMQAQPGTKRG